MILAPPCYCCPEIDPPNECKPYGCEEAFGKGYQGECVDVTNPYLNALSKVFDLNAVPEKNYTCLPSLEKSCCRCMKKKPCIDDGCMEAFHGDGICVDVENGDLSLVDTTVEKKLGLCKNNIKGKDCCYCYKKKSSCAKKTCEYKGIKGRCYGPTDFPPPDWKGTLGKCPGKDCNCYIPPQKPCSDPVCEETLRGQCVKNGASGPEHHR